MQIDLTLVIDIGKSHAKLLMVDAVGQVLERHDRDNAPVVSPLGYPALDIDGLTQWMCETLAASVATQRCARAIVSTHGAALVALGDGALNPTVAWAPIDYEFEDCTQTGSAQDMDYCNACDPFIDTLSPDLPMGLNAARQLYWMQHTHPKAWAATQTLLPYPQYWAWWLSGVASTEISSLGCHTQLWLPAQGGYSKLAQSQGWADLFAPLRAAGEVLGSVRPSLADALGLPRHCQVHVGVHDSNACLARYLKPQDKESSHPNDQASLTLISSGTWTVIMAPGADSHELAAERDMLGNVNVLGQPTPTARFMGGREFAYLLDGAASDAGSDEDVRSLVQTNTLALPSFAPQGGPFRQQAGEVLRDGNPLPLQQLPDSQRSALSALYCAQVTAWLVQKLRPELLIALDPNAPTSVHTAAAQPLIVVEGPLASNHLYLSLLQALLPASDCRVSVDTLEGTARGAWLLAVGAASASASEKFLNTVPRCNWPGLANYQMQWQQHLI